MSRTASLLVVGLGAAIACVGLAMAWLPAGIIAFGALVAAAGIERYRP
jgi:anti-sigma factor RsiW